MGKTIAFIPARGGSKSIPLKNIKSFYGQPLLLWNIKELLHVSEIDEIVVATDSEQIAKIAKIDSKVSIYYRNELNAKDGSSTESVMLEYITAKSLSPDDTFILVQATSPFTQQSDFEKGLSLYNEENIDSVLAVVPFKRLVWSEEKKPLTFDLDKRQRRQDFDTYYLENGAFYVNSVENIVANKSRISGRFGFHIMPDHTALEMDEPLDWAFGEIQMKKLIDNNEFTPNS
jgi:CMP-N-acetylneuraminic acid synthetase